MFLMMEKVFRCKRVSLKEKFTQMVHKKSFFLHKQLLIFLMLDFTIKEYYI